MDWLDVSILMSCNALAREWPIFDRAVVMVADNALLKGGLLMAVLWWQWFMDVTPGDRRERRVRVLATLAGALAAVAVARALALTVAFRPRPLHTAALGFVVPVGQTADSLGGWSSFPSDHATLFVALATGLLFLSRRIGVVALVYVFAVIAWPRVYLGLHYPSDILVGALLGAALATAANVWLSRSRLLARSLWMADARPAVFYGAMFLATFEIATLFDSVRAMGPVLALAVARTLTHAGPVAAATGALVAIALLAAVALCQRRVGARRAAHPVKPGRRP